MLQRIFGAVKLTLGPRRFLKLITLDFQTPGNKNKDIYYIYIFIFQIGFYLNIYYINIFQPLGRYQITHLFQRPVAPKKAGRRWRGAGAQRRGSRLAAGDSGDSGDSAGS